MENLGVINLGECPLCKRAIAEHEYYTGDGGKAHATFRIRREGNAHSVITCDACYDRVLTVRGGAVSKTARHEWTLTVDGLARLVAA